MSVTPSPGAAVAKMANAIEQQKMQLAPPAEQAPVDRMLSTKFIECAD